MSTLRLTLPLPPGVNNQYVTVGKRRVLSKDARAFNKQVAAVARALHMREDTETLLPALQAKPFACDLVFYFETPFKRDLDGGLKIALDAVCGGLGLDDRFVVSITLEKRIDPLRPRLEMEIGPAEGWRFDREYVVLDPE
ncbi:MAG TPA: RusA family crossover junction endodeoxyribonuclease [Thermomicrobiales bacterium]|nr:RusA family crossover junction endodeoxyribonuclease [Thermomicrobiales bacterium]